MDLRRGYILAVAIVSAIYRRECRRRRLTAHLIAWLLPYVGATQLESQQLEDLPFAVCIGHRLVVYGLNCRRWRCLCHRLALPVRRLGWFAIVGDWLPGSAFFSFPFFRQARLGCGCGCDRCGLSSSN